MRNLLVHVLLFMTPFLIYPNNFNDKDLGLLNDNLFSFDIEAVATSDLLTIVTNSPDQSVVVKVIDKSGFIRIEKQLHLDKDIDVSGLREGFYLIKVYSGNNMAVKRFYKGQDIVNNK